MKKYKVFLASSAELADERKEIDLMISRLNKKWIDNDIFMELVLWEELPHSFQGNRIQDYFNQEMLQCDIMIALFFKKVGQFTEEEFKLAYKSLKQGKNPRFLFVYFKSGSVSIDDVDEEILKIRKLKKEIEGYQEIYGTFTSTVELIQKLQHQLELIIAEKPVPRPGLREQISGYRTGLRKEMDRLELPGLPDIDSQILKLKYKYDLFLSFSTKDMDFVRPIWETLKKNGLNVFFSDETLKKNIGLTFDDAIEDALKRSKDFLLICSPNSMQSEWVQDEYKAFYHEIHKKNKKKRRFIIYEGIDFDNSLVPLIMTRLQRAKSVSEVIGILKDEEVQSNDQEKMTPRKKDLESLSSFRNPFEDNVEYIKIPGGTYKYSVTEKMITVPDIFFCKYPVTNKRYRKFISYLEGKEKALEKVLSLELYVQRLLEFSSSIKGYAEYLSQDSKKWQGKFRSKLDDNKKYNGDDQPVVEISWYAARAYCFWLSCLEGTPDSLYRLPTETEWEWAAGGEPDGSVREYPWPNEKGKPNPDLANYGENVGATTPVGRYPEGATPRGLMDMAGNVWEWMDNYYQEGKERRSLRGGSWNESDYGLRCSARVNLNPDVFWNVLGFRVVRGFVVGHKS